MPKVHIEIQLRITPDVVVPGIGSRESQIGRDAIPLGVWERRAYDSQPYVSPASRERTPRGRIELWTSSPVARSLGHKSPDTKAPRHASQVSRAFTKGTVPRRQRTFLPGSSGRRGRTWPAVAALMVALLGLLVVWSGFVGWPTATQEWASSINPWLTLTPTP